ncbi:hypothetical protein E4U45_002967, partial [Claviceps purpurea]
MLPKSSETLRTWIINEFLARKRTVQHELSEAVSRILISFDVWTSGVYSHYITSKGVRRRVLLDMKEIHGRHTAKNLALLLEQTLV